MITCTLPIMFSFGLLNFQNHLIRYISHLVEWISGENGVFLVDTWFGAFDDHPNGQANKTSEDRIREAVVRSI